MSRNLENILGVPADIIDISAFVSTIVYDIRMAGIYHVNDVK